jgi:hypothetical protein
VPLKTTPELSILFASLLAGLLIVTALFGCRRRDAPVAAAAVICASR